MVKLLKHLRVIPAVLALGVVTLLSGCYTMGQFSSLEADLEWLDNRQFQFVNKPFYTFDDVVARAMVGTTARGCEYFVISGPVAQTYPMAEGRFVMARSGVIREHTREVYIVSCYDDALTAPPGALSVKTHVDKYIRTKPKSVVFKEISDQRKVRGLREANIPNGTQM